MRMGEKEMLLTVVPPGGECVCLTPPLMQDSPPSLAALSLINWAVSQWATETTLGKPSLFFQGQLAPRRSCYAGARSRRLDTRESVSQTYLLPGQMGWLCVPWCTVCGLTYCEPGWGP